MPIITHILLYAAYAMISLTVGARAQPGRRRRIWAARSSAASPSSRRAPSRTRASRRQLPRVASASTKRRIKGDMERLRTAHREVTADIDAVQTRLDQIETQVAFGAPARAANRSAARNGGQIELR